MTQFMRKILLFQFLAVLSAAMFCPAPSSAQLLRVFIASTPPEEISVRTVHVQEEPFIPFDEMAQAAGWSISMEKTLYVATAAFGSHQVRVAGDNPFLLADREIFQMPLESRYHGGHIYVPVRYFFPVLARKMPDIIRYDAAQNVVEIAGKAAGSKEQAPQPSSSQPVARTVPEPSGFEGGYNLAGLTIEEKANGTLVRIRAARMFRQQDFSSWVKEEDGWLYVQIYGGRIDPASIAIRQGEGFIDRIVPVQQPQLAQISLKLSQPIESHEVGQDPRTREILITLYKKMSAAPAMDNEIAGLLKQQQKSWEIDVITIDAGHGGKDPGTIGRYYKTREKDIVLDIALQLGKMLESRSSIKVVYTRKNDTFVELWRRAQIANQSKSKLFVSIHANWNNSPTPRGFDVYILGQGKDEAAIQIAEKENGVIKEYESSLEEYEGFLSGNKMIYSIMQSGFAKESEALAANVSQSMGRALNTKNRGVKQARLYVQWRASMPNILVETGFVSNKAEEKNLRSSAYRQKIAEGIFQGIMSFIEEKQQNMARAAAGDY